MLAAASFDVPQRLSYTSNLRRIPSTHPLTSIRICPLVPLSRSLGLQNRELRGKPVSLVWRDRRCPRNCKRQAFVLTEVTGIA